MIDEIHLLKTSVKKWSFYLYRSNITHTRYTLYLYKYWFIYTGHVYCHV